MVDSLVQIYGLRDRKIMVDLTSWLEHTWVFCNRLTNQILMYTTPSSVRFVTHLALNAKTYNHSRSSKRSGIVPGDPITYNLNVIQRDGNWNQLKLVEFYRYIGKKEDSCAMRNVFEVILHILYHDNVLHKFPQFRSPCDGTTCIVNPAGKGTGTIFIWHNPYAR